MKLNAVTDAFCNVHLHGIVKRMGLPESAVDSPKIRVERTAWFRSCLRAARKEPDSARDTWGPVRSAGPQIACRSESRKNHVDIVHPVGLVDPPRSDVADRDGESGRQLTRHAHIPLHHVIAVWVAFGKIRGTRSRVG